MPKALKSCPKSNKSPNLVTLIPTCTIWMSKNVFCSKNEFRNMNKSAKMSQGTNQNEIWDFGQEELSENPPEALSSLKQQMLEKGIHLLIQSYISFLSNEKLDKCDFWIKICSNTFLSLLRPTTLLELFKWSLFHKILRIYQISSNFNKQRNTKNKNTKKQFYGKGPLL